MNKVENIIVHISDSTWGSASEIRKWHMEKGWKDIGYHLVILNGQVRPDFYLVTLDGSFEIGRYLDGDAFIEDNEIGAHALGYNDKSIGICGIGKIGWTEKQIISLYHLLIELTSYFHVPIDNILGHYETANGKTQGKTCPNLDMGEVRRNLR